MKDHFDTLEVPLTATPEEIKAKYRQLVRIYHPDRFTNEADKRYAEEKVKALNVAYAALLTPQPNRATTERDAPALPPAPTMQPATLDFGEIPPRRRKIANLLVDNTGGDVQNVSFSYSAGEHQEQTWFTVTKGRPVHPDQPLPLALDVVVNSASLTPGQRYEGWVEVNMDGVTARTAVLLAVQESAAPQIPVARLVIGALLVLLIIAIAVTVPLIASFRGAPRPVDHQAHVQAIVPVPMSPAVTLRAAGQVWNGPTVTRSIQG